MDVKRRVATALACSALDPSLAGVLLFNLDPSVIYPLATWLKDLLAFGSEDGPPLISLGPQLAEDTLWERFTLERADPERTEDPGFRWRPGRLARYGQAPGIVVVPDLAGLGLPATRAGIALLGADAAHLERSGVSEVWRPRDRWLAALARAEVDKVSAHLLDRFAIRVDASGLELPWNPGPDGDLPWDPDPELAQAVRGRLGAPLPGLSGPAAKRVLRIVAPGVPGARRYLALGRLARALAALDGDRETLPRHVDRAADLTGLRSRRATSFAWVGRSGATPGFAHGAETGRAPAGPLHRDGNGNGHLPVSEDESAEREFLIDPRAAYPEDTVRPGRDAPLLRLGWQRMLTGPPRGQPIGTQRALGNSDIAVAATILNAARFQRLRCPWAGAHYPLGHEPHVRKQDLLGYRRAPRPGQLLVLLLDHTCRVQDWDWYGPLSEYLGWAYVNRALVGVVEVGATPAVPDTTVGGELRATQFQARGVLDHRVLDALDSPADRPFGWATPLAHGLALAGELLRRSTQQGAPAVTEAILVVVTDGRGNVPLASSKSGATVPEEVGRRGVDDAIEQARKIQALGHGRRRMRSVVIDPGWQANGRLAAELAVELQAPLRHGTPTLPAALAGSADDWTDPDDGGRDA